jgi:hypothetical protein
LIATCHSVRWLEIEFHFMDCNEAQDRLLNADLVEPQTQEPDVAAHLETCPACRAMMDGLRRLESAARDLPTVPDAAITRQAFLELLAPAQAIATPRPALHNRMLLWPRRMALSSRRLAAAASILLATGLVLWAVWFHGAQKAAASDAVVDNLVDWDVRLASADSADQRQQLYASMAPSLQKSIIDLPVKATDRDLAEKLLQTGASLSQSVDPLDDAEHFADVADLLLDRMKSAAGAGKAADAERFAHYYSRVTDEGLAKKLSQAHHGGGNGKAARRARLERLNRRNRELEARLDKLLEQSPEPSRKQIRRAIKGGNHPHH